MSQDEKRVGPDQIRLDAFSSVPVKKEYVVKLPLYIYYEYKSE